MCVFVVEDKGIGMPAEHISRAFWIFERLHPRENYPERELGSPLWQKPSSEWMGGWERSRSRISGANFGLNWPQFPR
jgi:light-regulated signal transduction histidine kinase (bacteriophytochrome)